MHRHPLDALSLLPGAAFAAIGLLFLNVNLNVLRLDWSWVWPAAAILVGLALLLSLRPQPQDRAEAPSDDAAGEDLADAAPDEPQPHA